MPAEYCVFAEIDIIHRRFGIDGGIPIRNALGTAYTSLLMLIAGMSIGLILLRTLGLSIGILQFGVEFGPYNPVWKTLLFFIISFSLVAIMHIPILLSLYIRVSIGRIYPNWYETPYEMQEHFKRAGRRAILATVSVWIVLLLPGIGDWTLATVYVTSVFTYFIILSVLAFLQYTEYRTLFWY